MIDHRKTVLECKKNVSGTIKKQDRRSIDAIVIRLQWLLMTMLLQNVKKKSNMNEIMDTYLNVQIFKCLDI